MRHEISRNAGADIFANSLQLVHEFVRLDGAPSDVRSWRSFDRAFIQNYCRYRREKKRSDRARYKGRVIVEREQATDSDSRTREC
jgi:hypothetical protein